MRVQIYLLLVLIHLLSFLLIFRSWLTVHDLGMEVRENLSVCKGWKFIAHLHATRVEVLERKVIPMRILVIIWLCVVLLRCIIIGFVTHLYPICVTHIQCHLVIHYHFLIWKTNTLRIFAILSLSFALWTWLTSCSCVLRFNITSLIFNLVLTRRLADSVLGSMRLLWKSNVIKLILGVVLFVLRLIWESTVIELDLFTHMFLNEQVVLLRMFVDFSLIGLLLSFWLPG